MAMIAENKSTTRKAWKAASYVRLSREDQIGEVSDSIQNQRRLIDDWARERGDVRIVAHYSDDGWSGATFDRPGFQQMIADAQSGMFDTIVVKDLSRFGRSYLDCGSWIERELPQLGVRLYSIADDFDSMQAWDYNMALLLPLKNLMNEMMVITTSEKVRTSLDAKRRRGECVSNYAPYGYAKDPVNPHHLIIDEKAAAVVRRIFTLRAAGCSAREIARRLNSARVPCPTKYRQTGGSRYQNCFCTSDDPRWHAKTVLRILRNEVYTGTLVQGKTQRLNWRMKVSAAVPNDQWRRTFQAHERIIEQSLFDEVTALLESGIKDIPVEYTVLFSGHVYCSGCGKKMTRLAVRKNGKTYAYYTCSTHRRNPRSCSTHSIREERLIELTKGMPESTKISVTEDGLIMAE